MKPIPFLLFSLVANIAIPAPVSACGPDFPPSYFSNDPIPDQLTTGMEFSLRPDQVAELTLIGRHYYPAWNGRRRNHNPIKTSEARRLDFFSAAAWAGISDEAAAVQWQNYCDFDAACADLCRAGTPPPLPDGTGIFLEFYLYTLGRGEFMAEPGNPAPEAWRRLLALPPEKRHFRTVWVKFMQLLAPSEFDPVDAALADFRTALDAGFADTAGLEESAIRQLTRRHPVTGFRYYPLALAALAEDNPFRSALRNDFAIWGSPRLTEKNPDFFAAMMQDRVGREIITVCRPELVLTYALPPADQTAILTADRQAWRLFHLGDFAAARKMLLLAPESSLIRLYLESRLARMDGDFETSTRHLRRFLEIYRERGEIPEGFQCDAATLPEVVAGELGMVRVLRRDFQEALYGFLVGNSWLDAAMVAERLMTTPELKTFVDTHPDIRFSGQLRYLLARRLMREYQPRQAEPYFAGECREDCRRYLALSESANDPNQPGDIRALKFYHLAGLVAAHGLELFGTELEPDNFIHRGLFTRSGIPTSWGQPAIMENLTPKVQGRFHYRARAAELAGRAALMATDPDLKVAALWLGGVVSRSRPPLEQDFFYHALCDLTPHPAALQAREAKWIPAEVWQKVLALSRQPGEPSLAEVKQMVAELTTPAEEAQRPQP